MFAVSKVYGFQPVANRKEQDQDQDGKKRNHHAERDIRIKAQCQCRSAACGSPFLGFFVSRLKKYNDKKQGQCGKEGEGIGAKSGARQGHGVTRGRHEKCRQKGGIFSETSLGQKISYQNSGKSEQARNNVMLPGTAAEESDR